jgi:gliding motility-associated-like protein
MKRLHYLLLLLVCFTSYQVNASHIIGGEIYYDYLGNNNYRISVAVYRDCATVSGAPYDNPLYLAIYNSNNQLVDNVSINFPGSTVLPIVFTNPCVVTPSGFCNEKAIYTTIVNLPPIPGGYNVSYQRCCRRPDVINISNPGSTGLTLTTHITGTNSNALVNSSPRFSTYPPLVLCNNDDLVFNHSAIDPDGDQLVYELITPYAGASDVAPQPNPAPPPLYNPIIWASGFSASNPLGPGATISLDPNTGVLTTNPGLTGMFVVGIRVKEYRNGVLIGQTDRDFIFKVISCEITLQASITPQNEMSTFTSFCQGMTISFDNQSYGGTQYSWDFGVQNATNDVSSLFEPTFTFPGPGTYDVTLIVNPGWPCTDTSTQQFILNEDMDVSFSVQDSICFLENSFDFVGNYNGPAGAVYQYTFGSSASIPTSNLLSVNDVSFNTTGFIPVTLTSSFGTCFREYKDSVYIFPNATAGFSFPTNTECAGLSVSFTNSSQNAQNSIWDFGITNQTSDISTQTNPSFTFPSGGAYNVTLIVNNNSVCYDTLTQTVSVFDPIQVSFTHTDSLCVTDNSFNFDGTYSGPPNTTVQWNFGPNASIQSSTQEDVDSVVYSSPGIFPVTLTASYNSCAATATSTVTIFRVPEIEFTIEEDLRCAPYPANFIDQSISDTPISYIWDFGDGTTSTEENPTHIYTDSGNYSVQLSIITYDGCADTLSLLKPNLLEVHPAPISKFTVSPTLVDICHSDVHFSDLSVDAVDYYYLFDDAGEISTEKNPNHFYITSGQKYPRLIVTNEFGCMDTSYQSLYVEPFTVFIPNTFTPDGDEFNNILKPIIYLTVTSWDFRIYDRLGELLFVSNDPAYGWDGTYGGKIVQDDTYTYVLTYFSCDTNSAEHVITGHVNVLR